MAQILRHTEFQYTRQARAEPRQFWVGRATAQGVLGVLLPSFMAAQTVFSDFCAFSHSRLAFLRRLHFRFFSALELCREFQE